MAWQLVVAAAMKSTSTGTIEIAMVTNKINPASTDQGYIKKINQGRRSVEGRAMENQETKRREDMEIGIIDGITFALSLLFAFLMDRQKGAAVRN